MRFPWTHACTNPTAGGRHVAVEAVTAAIAADYLRALAEVLDNRVPTTNYPADEPERIRSIVEKLRADLPKVPEGYTALYGHELVGTLEGLLEQPKR